MLEDCGGDGVAEALAAAIAVAASLAVPDQVPVTRLPTAAEFDLIRGALDPSGLRDRELT